MNQILILFAAVLSVIASHPAQPPGLAPYETEQGVLFQCYAPEKERVYLAGEFNAWAHNREGHIRDNRFMMQGPDSNGVFSRTVPLLPGVHAYKFCIDGKPDGWFAPSNTRHTDDDGNALVIVDGTLDDNAEVNTAQSPLAVGNDVTFEIHAPAAHIVFLAGSFNNWANNNIGWVHDHQFAMQGPDADGIWRKNVKIPSGRHRYQFVIDGRTWIQDPLSDRSTPNNHSILEVP